MADLNFAGPTAGINKQEPQKEENLLQSMTAEQEPVKVAQAAASAIQAGQTLSKKTDARVAAVDAEGAAQKMADFAVPVTPDQWRMISTAASQSDNPDEELHRYAAALTYSREYGVDVDVALQNLEAFNTHQLGKPYTPNSTSTQAIANSFKVGRMNMEFNDLAYDLKQADLKGEDISGYLTELDAMATEIASLQDYQPRNIVTTALKWTMEGAVPYMIEVGKASLIGATAAGALGTAFTGATGIALGSLTAATPWTMAGIIAMGATVGAINRTRQLEEGATYLNLRQMGVDKDIANVLSRTNAMVVGAIEAGLGIEAGTVLKAIGGDTLASQVTSAVVARLNTSGALGALANAAVSTTVGAGGEFIQEFTQEISDITHTYIAHAWQSMRTDTEPLPDENTLKQALYAGYRGFVSAIVLGAASSVVNSNFDLRQQAQMKADAKANPSKEAFVASLKDSKPESVTGADWSEATSGIWEKAHKGQKESTSIQSEEAAVNELDYGAGEKARGPVRTLSTGELYTEEDGTPTTDTSGAEHHRLLVGDPATGSRYGHIDYEISDNTLTINDVRVKSGYENIRQESILSLAKQYPGYDIQWEAKGKNLQAIKDSIIESNPRGKDAGLQYFDGVTNVDERIKLESQIKEAMPNLNASERALGATMIQLTAEAQGKTAEAYLQSSFKDGKLFGDTQDLDSAMQGKKGAVSFTNDLKAIIYAGEKADFSTFAHETFHVAMRNMGQLEQFKTAVTEAAQTPEFTTWLEDHAELFKDSNFEGMSSKDLAELAADFSTENWARKHDEFSARLYEGYLADGKTASPKLQGLFRRIAEWMGRIYTTLKQSVALDARIVEVFDSMLDADTPLAQAARESQDQERTTTHSKDTAQTLYQETDEQRQYDAVVSEYRGTEQWMKAPNGKPTNLNERQWVQVRTPAFIEWFGDWINDPENASKVVDENGEPKVMYHGTISDPFTTFDPKASGRGIIYTTEDMAYAEDYIKNSDGNVMEVFVNMRHPADPANDNASIKIIADIHKEDADVVLEAFTDGYDPYELLENPKIITALKENGYDGVVFYEEGQLTHGVFDSNQIKSATDNQGTFDANNPSILFQEPNEKRPLEKRVSKDYLLDVKDMIDEITEVGGKVSDLGIITVYHATSKNSAKNIKNTGRMIAKEDGLFFSTKSDGQITGYGESVVKFEIPAELLIIDDIFEDEAHLVLELGKSRSKNIGMYNPTILFQEENREAITEQILEDARGFETWEAMKYYYEGLYGTDMWGDILDEAYQSDEWYQAVFNEANGISEAAAKAVDPQMSPEARLADEKQKDTYIKEKLSTDEGIKAFMEKLGWILNVGFDKEAPGMQDRQMAATVQDLRNTLPDLVHPTILSNAKRVAGGKAITASSLKRIRTLMTGDALRYYRDIYADVMEDPQLKPQVIDERLPSIESPGYNLTGFSITDRIKLADSIEAAPLRKAILSGKEKLEGSAEIVIKDMNREIDDSNKQIEKLERELKEMESKLSKSEMWHFHYAKQYSEAVRLLDAEMKQIRKLTNEDRQVSDEQMKRATRLQTKIDLLHDQVMKNRASERVNATVKRHEALAQLKEKLKEKQKTKDDARKVREYKLKLARKIMIKPSDAINYDQAQLIYKLQATLDPVFRQKSMEIEIDGEQQRMTIEEAREALDGVSDEELQMAMSQRLYERIIGERKPLNDWTIEDLEQTLETVANLRKEGRAILAAKQEQKQIIAQNYQDAIIRSLMATGKYTSQPLVGTRQDQKEKNHPINIARAFRYGTLAMRPKAMMLDNNTQGAAYKLLVTMKRAAQNAEWRAIEKRMDPVFKVMKEYGITEKDLYQTVQISLGERMEEYTYSHLMYVWLSQHDESNLKAVSYGNLVSKDEKISLDHDNDLIRELGDSRYRQLMDQVQYHLETQDESGGYMAVVKAVQEDFNTQAPRLNEIAIREFNKAMRVVEQYLPIHRKEFSGADMRQQVAEDLFNAKAGSNATGVAKGFQKDRIKISPDHQTPVNLDLMGVWNKSARQQEHFIAFAEYGRTLNRVFKNLGSRDLENAINRTLGKEMYQDVTEYINQIINPQAINKLQGLEKGVKFMRGNLGAAYLTWKMGGLVLQAITSPMPYLANIRADKLVAAYFHIFAHPIKSIEFINSKSAMMKNRTMNVIIDQILQESRTYTDNRLVRWNRKQQEIGSMGLTLVDRYAVAGGWLAAYEQKLNELQSQGITFTEADAQAIVYADDLVLKVQPTGDATEIAPLFTTGSEFARAFTQFQTSLNVIWANITYDMPQAFKKAADSSLPNEVRMQQFSQAMGTIVGYALAGALLGAVAEGHDEDDDTKDKLRNWLYWSFTQGTASVPFVGDMVDNLVESAVTGDKPHVFSDEFFPGISKIFKGAVYLTQADIEKGLKNLVEGGGYMTGLPVSGVKQMKKAITEDPGALLGR